jgi:predicted MFS family arabinose efflux permease
MESTSMVYTFITRVKGASRELKLYAIATLSLGMAYSIISSILNNFLNDRFSLTGFQRSFLELPRELPGFLVVFISALLWFLCSRRLGAIAMLLGAVGSLLMAYVSYTYAMMVMCLFIYSLGQHIFLPISSTIGMELAKEGKTGQRLGQMNALTNLAAVFGSFLVVIGFRFLGFNFQLTFILAAVGFIIAAFLLYAMKTEKIQQPRLYLKLHKEYRLYYLLSVLYGSRKQIFMTFGLWVIVTIFNQPTSVIATLVTIGGIIGILFQPLLGRAVDHLGERFVLSAEALLLVVVCFGYGFSKFLFSENMAFLIICVCYLLDQMLMTVNMARATYMKKIALSPEDVQPALTASVTIDHFFSIIIALIGGVIWNYFGFQYVFLMGMLIAMGNFMAALRVRVPAGLLKSAAN